MVKGFIKWCINYFKHPFKRTTQNCECYDNEGNFIGWFSRSMAVVNFVLARDNDGDICVLASQRGKGTPDPEFVGAWNCCCGYLDFNESLADAAVREVYEETGVDIDCDVQVWNINSSPNEKRQNVTVRHYTFLPNKTTLYEKQFSHKHNEKDEVDEIRFIKVKDVDRYKWAFGHDKLINELIKEKYTE